MNPDWVDVFGLDCATTNYDIPYTAKGPASIFAGWGAALMMEAAGSWIAVRGAAAARVRIAGLAAGRATREEIAEMERILEAIQRRDEGAAHRSMLDHFIAVETLVTSALGLDRRDAPAHREKRSAKS